MMRVRFKGKVGGGTIRVSARSRVQDRAWPVLGVPKWKGQNFPAVGLWLVEISDSRGTYFSNPKQTNTVLPVVVLVLRIGPRRQQSSIEANDDDSAGLL